MSMRYQAGIVLPGYNALKVANAPTIGTATVASSTSVSVAFTAPACTGGGAISGYTVFANCGVKLTSGASSPLVVTGLTTGTAYTFKAIATNAYGPSYPSAASNSATPLAIGQDAYTTAGTYSWVAPAGVTSASIVAVGGGGGAADDYNSAGGGGGLGYKNNYSVTPGSSYTVVVGAAGVSGKGSGQSGGAGGTSYFVSTGTVRGIGGSGGSNPPSACNTPGGSFTGDGGGAGGTGGRGAGGGGGAGGYAGTGGNGGTGGSGPNMAGLNGAGGGGGGGSSYGGGAGGVGILGQGSNGTGGAVPPGSDGNPGTGGSGGAAGLQGCNSPNSGAGGAYGGGAGSGTRTVGCAGRGAVRIIYPGTTRSFPSTCTGNL